MQIIWTSGIADAAHGNFEFFNEVLACQKRFFNHDWGDLCEEDRRTNERALTNGGRLFAKYNTSKGPIYIIMDNISMTTVLFPDEY